MKRPQFTIRRVFASVLFVGLACGWEFCGWLLHSSIPQVGSPNVLILLFTFLLEGALIGAAIGVFFGATAKDGAKVGAKVGAMLPIILIMGAALVLSFLNS